MAEDERGVMTSRWVRLWLLVWFLSTFIFAYEYSAHERRVWNDLAADAAAYARGQR